MGLRAMERIEDEMKVIWREASAAKRWQTPAPALAIPVHLSDFPEIIDTAQAVIDRGKAEMGKWFGRLPKAGVSIHPYPSSGRRPVRRDGMNRRRGWLRPAIFSSIPPVRPSTRGPTARTPRCTRRSGPSPAGGDREGADDLHPPRTFSSGS
jgi:hypothetical protein